MGIKVCLDSRLVKEGEYFVAVKGKKFDGHDFIKEALKRGAAGILEEEDLYKLAKDKLETVKPRVVGVAGSVGKSSFRRFLTQMLRVKLGVLEGDLNTKLGLAVNIVNGLDDQSVIVAEMGIGGIGEMDKMVEFLQPEFGVITKIELEHIEFLKSLKNVVEENFILVERSKRGLGYLNKLDKRFFKEKTSWELRWFPEKVPVEVKRLIGNFFRAEHDRVYLQAIYQIVANEFGFSKDQFIKSLGGLDKPRGRLNLIPGIGGSLIVDDSYNAVSDQSVIAGLEFAKKLAKDQARRLVVVLSPMKETGDMEEQMHKRVACFLNSMQVDELILVGDNRGLYGKHLEMGFKEVDSSEAVEVVVDKDVLVYVKGSQSYRMEKVVYKLMRDKDKAGELLVRQDKRWC